MNKIYFFFLLLTGNMAFGQINFGLRQELEKTTGLGQDMQVYGNTMLLSKYRQDEVKVYTRQSDGTWIFQQTLKPSDKSAGISTDWGFGNSMALNDSSAVITAVYKGLIKENAGGVYFFRRDSDGLWQEEFIFENPTTFSYYGGKNVAIHKNKVTISHNNGYPRFVHIFERSDNGFWTIADTITETEFVGLDGKKVFFNDSTFIAMSFDFDNQKVKEFRLQANGNWINTQTLETGITSYDTYFGQFLSVDNNQMAIGAPSFKTPIDSQVVNTGKVFVYERVNNEWILQQELVSPAPQVNERFGDDVLIKGDMLIITSEYTENISGSRAGAIYIYQKNDETWTLAQTYFPENQNKIGRNVFYENDQIISWGPNSVHILENIKDCQGVVGGTAKLNSCNICYGGTTGLDLLQSEEQCTSTSLHVVSSKGDVAVSPNPFSEAINIQAAGYTRIALVDCYGKVIAKNISPGFFDTSFLNPGMYFLILENEDEKSTLKIFKK